MLTSHSNKAAVETFIVAKAGETFLADGATTLVSTTSPYPIQLNDGQIGMFSASHDGTLANNIAASATPTIATAPVLKFVQGTANSADPTAFSNANLPIRTREESAPIDARSSVYATYQAYEAPTFCTNFLGGPSGQITALDSTEYALRMAFRGRTMDEYYNPEGALQLGVSRTTPNFTTLATAEPVDYIYQHLIWDLNRNSSAVTIDKTHLRGRYPFVALAIDTTGLTGGTIISTLTPGFIPLVNTTAGVRGAQFTQAQLDSINAGVTAAGYVPGTATLLIVDLTTAGTVTGGVADSIMTLTLDRTPAFSDKIPQVKIQSTLGLTSGFDYLTVTNTVATRAGEGQGISRTLDLQYKATHGQRKYYAYHEMDPVLEYPTDFVTGATYDTFVIRHEEAKHIDTLNVIASPQKTIICVPTADTVAIAAITAGLDSWLVSGGNPAVQS